MEGEYNLIGKNDEILSQGCGEPVADSNKQGHSFSWYFVFYCPKDVE